MSDTGPIYLDYNATAPIKPQVVEAVAEAMIAYARRETARGVPVKCITRHMLGLFNGLPGARAWRRSLSESAHRPGAGPEVIAAALDAVMARQARSRAA